MGRQDSIIKIQGQIGGISFYKGKDGVYMARQKTGVNPDRIKNDPEYARTRENGSEFGRAGKGSKLLRNALRELLVTMADSGVSNRLTRQMLKVVQADKTSIRGQRNILDGETELLKGFEFNVNSTLESKVRLQFTSSIDRAAGTMHVTLPEFRPNKMIETPEGATHFKFIVAGVEVDFETGKYVLSTTTSDPISTTEAQLVNVPALGGQVNPGTAHPIFLVLGIEFHQQVNGQEYAIQNGAYNALSIVAVDGGA